MAYVWQRWMPAAFRAAGLTVIEVEGWQNRGRPASTGSYNPTEGVTNHHTGSTTSERSPAPTLRTLIVGRPDLPGPLAPWSVDWLGRVFVIAAGRCNHAGRVGKRVAFAALGADGNAIFMGDEIDTNGTQVMPAAQRRAVAITNRVYLEQVRRDVRDLTRIHRHADISGTGKWDLGSLNSPQLRDDTAAVTTTPEEDIDIMDAATRKYLDGQFARGRQQTASVKTAVKAVAGALEVIADTVGEGDEKILARVTKSKRELAAAIVGLNTDATEAAPTPAGSPK